MGAGPHCPPLIKTTLTPLPKASHSIIKDLEKSGRANTSGWVSASFSSRKAISIA